MHLCTSRTGARSISEHGRAWRCQTPHPTPAFPFNGMAFPVTGRSHLMEWRSHLLGVPSYWAFPWPGGGARPWPSGAWDEESGADLDRGRSRTWGGRVPRHFLLPQQHLAMAWRRRQAMGTPRNWERPVTGNATRFPKTPGWGGEGFPQPPVS